MALRTLTAKLTPSLPKIFNIKMSEQNILPFSSTTSHSVNFSKSRYVAHPLLNTNLLILLMRFLLYNPHAKEIDLLTSFPTNSVSLFTCSSLTCWSRLSSESACMVCELCLLSKSSCSFSRVFSFLWRLLIFAFKSFIIVSCDNLLASSLLICTENNFSLSVKWYVHQSKWICAYQ